MRVTLPFIFAAVCIAVLIWFLFGDDPAGEHTGESELVGGPEEKPERPKPQQEPAAGKWMHPARDGSGLAPIEVTVVDALPAGLEEFVQGGGQSLFDELDLREQIVRFEIDPGKARFLTGEDLLRSISELRGVDKPLHFLKSEDLDKFRKHVFGKIVEPRSQAAEMIDHCHPIGYVPVAWKGEFYMVPVGGAPLESLPDPDAGEPR